MSEHEWPHDIEDNPCMARISQVCEGIAVDNHHVIPKGDGGSNRKANLKPVCKACHNYIHDHEPWAFSVGLIQRGTGRRQLRGTRNPRQLLSDEDRAEILHQSKSPTLSEWRAQRSEQ